MSRLISRRDLLKLGSSALALAALPPLPLPPDDQAARRESTFGRVTTWRAEVHSEPHPDAPAVGERRGDDIVNIMEEVPGLGHYDHNPIWYRIVGGYIYSSWVQPVEYRFNEPITHVESPGLLALVTVPYTEVHTQPDSSSPVRYRLYYDSVFRVVDVEVTVKAAQEGAAPSDLAAFERRGGKMERRQAPRQVWYGVRDGLTWSGINWARAEHLRIIPPQELTPLSSKVKDKRILIELGKQRLTCFEGQDAVFETHLSSGMPGMVTPVGTHRVLRKVPTTRMIGGVGRNYYDLPGIGFVTYFTARGVAIHGTYWHNDYGRRRSHGCVNTPTAAAQWIYRWTRPDVPYDSQSLVASAQDATSIEVVY